MLDQLDVEIGEVAVIRPVLCHANSALKACFGTQANIGPPSVFRAVVVVCSLIGTATLAQQDTDGDGLLDLLDVPGFPRWTLYSCNFYSGQSVCNIQDLDGANQLTYLTHLSFEGNQIASVEAGGL